LKAAEELPYRLGVGIMLLNENNKVFVGKRIDTRSEAWQMPQGGVEDGEALQDAALRELQEEVGTDKVKFVAMSAKWYYYDLPQELIPIIWDGKYRGQKQKWFVYRLCADDSVIDINTGNPEFCQWKWIDIDKLPEVIVVFKKDIYRAIVNEFRYLVK
jgi:putative (di)nucleoside polyphosphate hydrolase